MVIQRFEDLDCWKAARELVKMVYSMTRDEPFLKDFGLRDQVRRSAISVMANITEGFATRSNAEFIRFLDFSTRSAFEVQSHLYIALDVEYVGQDDFKIVFDKAQDCANLCRGFIRYLKNET